MFRDYRDVQATPVNVRSWREVETFLRNQLVDAPIPQLQKNLAVSLALKNLMAQNIIQKKSRKGFGNFGFTIGNPFEAIQHAVQQVSDIATKATKPISEPVVKTVVGFQRQVVEAVNDLYKENFGPKHDTRIPTNDELVKAGDTDGSGFILTNKINRLLPVGVSLNTVAQTQAMMGTTEWHNLNFQMNHLLPWLIKNQWISFNVATQRWNMPFRSGIGQMNGTGRYGSGDFYIDIYGWHNLNDEAMLGVITTFAPIFGYTDQQKTDLTNTINALAESVHNKSGREWNASATRIAVAVVAVVAVAVFVGPAVLGAVQGAVAAGAGAFGLAVPTAGATAAVVGAGESYVAAKALTPVTDPLTKQLTDGVIGAVMPATITLPDNSLNFDTVLKSIQLNPNLTAQQKNNAAVVIKKNKDIQATQSKSALKTIGVMGATVLGAAVLL